MPKPSILTALSPSQSNGDDQPGSPSNVTSPQSPIRMTGDISSSTATVTDTTTAATSTTKRSQTSSSQARSQSPSLSRRFINNALSRRQQADSSSSSKLKPNTTTTTTKTIPPELPANDLDPPSTRHLHPYRASPGSSIASLSHGNLLETASVTSESVDESAASEAPESDPGFKSSSVPRVDADHHQPHPLRQSRKPNKHVFQQLMSRSRSITQDGNRLHPSSLNKERLFESSRSRERTMGEIPQTAPLEPDRSYREAMDSKLRNRSADRSTAIVDDGLDQPRPATSRFAHLVNTSSRAAGDIGRAGKGFFGKFARSGSHSTEREVTMDEHYQLKVINLPLVEQTRLTRIRQRMSDAKDKTEFWLPALPYRCIDFLNLKGCEVEGLYRVPGSVREVKLWQMRFDTELDVNLLDEPDLDDVNTIGSILKAWLRDQPDALIPASVQKRISEECADAVAEGNAPQFLKDELSKLPPFNYYLLFAVTAHLALLQKHSDLNKMDFRNLCICFQPCMNIDPVPFHFLVKDWRNCWQGCWPEKEYLEEEYRVMTGEATSPVADRINGATNSATGQKSTPTPGLAVPRLPSPVLSGQQPPPTRPTRASDDGMFGIDIDKPQSPPSVTTNSPPRL